jgi:hypothetical protein
MRIGASSRLLITLGATLVLTLGVTALGGGFSQAEPTTTSTTSTTTTSITLGTSVRGTMPVLSPRECLARVQPDTSIHGSVHAWSGDKSYSMVELELDAGPTCIFCIKYTVPANPRGAALTGSMRLTGSMLTVQPNSGKSVTVDVSEPVACPTPSGGTTPATPETNPSQHQTDGQGQGEATNPPNQSAPSNASTTPPPASSHGNKVGA